MPAQWPSSARCLPSTIRPQQPQPLSPAMRRPRRHYRPSRSNWVARAQPTANWPTPSYLRLSIAARGQWDDPKREPSFPSSRETTRPRRTVRGLLRTVGLGEPQRRHRCPARAAGSRPNRSPAAASGELQVRARGHHPGPDWDHSPTPGHRARSAPRRSAPVQRAPFPGHDSQRQNRLRPRTRLGNDCRVGRTNLSAFRPRPAPVLRPVRQPERLPAQAISQPRPEQPPQALSRWRAVESRWQVRRHFRQRKEPAGWNGRGPAGRPRARWLSLAR